jgi:uncharacterized YceG family protein
LARGNRSKPPRERTAEEREHDREERERRRAGLMNEATQDAPVAATPVEPAGDTPEDPQTVEVVPPIPVPVEEPAEIPPIPAPVEDPPVPPPSQSQLPRPARRDVLLDQRRHRLRRGRVASDGERLGLTRARVGALIALAAAVAVVWFLASLFQPFAGTGHGRVIVLIPKGSSASKVGSILARDGVVSSGFFFDLRALVEGRRGELHSGRFLLRHDESYAAAIAVLSKPPPATIAVKVVIPEGETRLQIASIAAADGLSGSYMAASAERSSLLSLATYGAPRRTSSLEGFLFPATYDMTAGEPVSRLAAEQLTAFRERFGAEEIRRARELNVTPYQLLTVASMVEREAQLPGDRPKIAAVIYNRLRLNMPLGIDATIYYAVEQAQGIATYTGELTLAQLHIDSPYNTRTHRGLPPTPISNPGLASIQAAAHPAHVPYLYYVAGADGCGEQVFSTTYAQFERDAATYDAAVKRHGGKPPVCKQK